MTEIQNDEKKNNYFGYIESAVVIAFASAILYWLGYLYIAGFVFRLGIDLASLNFPTEFYLRSGIISISNLVLFAVLGVIGDHLFRWGIKFLPKQSNANLILTAPSTEAFSRNLPFLFCCGEAIRMSLTFYSVPDLWAVLCVVVLIYCSWKGQTLVMELVKRAWPGRLIIIFLFFLTTMIYSMQYGESAAIALIEKRRSPATIEFKWKNASPQEIQGKELILVFHQDGKYFVVPFSSSAPKYPQTYVIPDDQIEFAMTHRNQ